MTDPAQVLKDFKPTKKFFIGIDSDGCVFDTMEIKQKECFCPMLVKYFNLQAVSKYAREALEFVNLYSKDRGVNRFPAVVRVMDLLREREEVKARGVTIPELPRLRQWIKEETRLGNPALKALVEKTRDPELKTVLDWAENVNKMIAEIVYNVPPFPLVRECLDKALPQADMIVVSQTPGEALTREWREHHVDSLVHIIAGQEMGTKKEHLQFAAGGKYPPENILMIGDAYGDLKAAQGVNALFYPVIPGREEASWERLLHEGLDKFFNGAFQGRYAEGLMQELDKALPVNPPWKKA